MNLLVLDRQALRGALPMAEAIDGMKHAYQQLSTGNAVVPLRGSLPVSEEDGVTLLMPALLSQSKAMAVKVVSVFPNNPGRGLPTIHAVVLALESSTGRPLALMEGASLTALRTGAASGAATDLLARPEAETVAIFGAGVQARTQLEAVCTVRTVRRVRVYDTDKDNAQTFAAEMAGQGPIPEAVEVAANPQEAVAHADIVCTATTSQRPVFRGEDLQSGAHINAIGSFTPKMEEVDLTTLQRSLIVVDSKEAALEEAGDLLGPMGRGELAEDSIHGEIGEILAGKLPGRTSPDQITYFKSVGVAVQDAIAASRALAGAKRLGLGQSLEL